MSTKNYRDLIAWQKAMDLVEIIYSLTRGFPKEELYGLTSQMRRSAISIPSNIAEGQGRGSKPDFARFLSIAYASIRELETQLLIAQRLGYLSQERLLPALNLCDEIGRLTTGLRKKLQSPKN